MFSTILDVAIGLVFVYVLFAIFVATVVEVISTILQLRSAALENAFARLLEDPQAAQGAAAVSFGWFGMLNWFSMFGGHAQLAQAQEEARAAAGPAQGAAAPLPYTAVFNHPLVGGTQAQNRPAYVSSQNFTSALLFVLRGAATGTIFSDFAGAVNQLPAGSLKTTLTTLIREAQGDLDALKAGIARWYDSSMDRLSGEYKRSAQLITFLVGFAIAAACNVDTIHMVSRLYAEPALRASLSETAAKYVKSQPKPAVSAAADASKAAGAAGAASAQNAAAGANAASASTGAVQNAAETTTAATTEQVEAQFQAAQKAEDLLMKTAPVGWASVQVPAAPTSTSGKVQDFLADPRIWWWGLAVLGWLVTALAAMLGAPFWFDLLQKLVNVRNTGPKPAAAAGSGGG
jgi:hypothetical protein